jgi:hypothetical protein
MCYSIRFAALLLLMASFAAPGRPLAQEEDFDGYLGWFDILSPPSIAGWFKGGTQYDWDPPTFWSVVGPVVEAEPPDACSELTNAPFVLRQIVLIRRGDCQFGFKALMAENAGARAFLIYHHDPTEPTLLVNMSAGDYGHLVSIPGLFITWEQGDSILGVLRNEEVRVSLTRVWGSSEPDAEVAGTHTLSTAYPNPFNPQTRFTLSVARTQHVTITLHDLLGRTVETIHQGHLAAGSPHEFTIDGSRLPSGTYLYRVVGETFSQTRRVTLLR